VNLLTKMIFVYVLLVALCASIHAQGPLEYEVKAAFLYNFAKFTEWPVEEEGEDPIVIGVLGEDPFGELLDNTVRGKLVRGRTLQIKRFDKLSEDLKGCHILFIGVSESNRIARALKYLEGARVLTVGESRTFCSVGGSINFVLDRRRVRFEISVAAAERAGLKLSSKLLKLATLVGP
jgi:hypothetical protein